MKKEAKEDEEAIPDFNDKQNIKSILQSDQFWNNIFQEMKFESLQSPLDYIEYLPSLKQLKNFTMKYWSIFYLISIPLNLILKRSQILKRPSIYKDYTTCISQNLTITTLE